MKKKTKRKKAVSLSACKLLSVYNIIIMSDSKSFRFDGSSEDWNEYASHLKENGLTIQEDLTSDIMQKLTLIRRENKDIAKTSSAHADHLSQYIADNHDLSSVRLVTGTIHITLSEPEHVELINTCGIQTGDRITLAAHLAIENYWIQRIANQRVNAMSDVLLQERIENIAGNVKQKKEIIVIQEMTKIRMSGRTKGFEENAVNRVTVTWDCPVVPKTTISGLRESDIESVYQFDCTIIGPSTKKIDTETGLYVQKILIQELESDARNSNPMVIKCIVHGDCTANLASGQTKRILGRYRVEPVIEGQKASNEKNLIIDAFDVRDIEEQKEITLSARMLERARDAAHDDSQQYMDYLIDSFCPKIYGRRLEKLALILVLLGGTKTYNFRNEQHLMLIGESDTGKSELVKFANKVAQKSSIIDGANATGVGILFAMDEYDGTRILRSGVMIQNSGGHLIIDEFDKMPTAEQKKVNNAMEQQRATYNKGGHVGNAETKTAVIASCNPEKERWNEDNDIIDNFPFEASTISRFDIIIRLKHESSEMEQRAKMKHIFNYKKGITKQIAPVEYLKGLFTHLRKQTPKFTDDAEKLMVDRFVDFQFLDQNEGSLQVETRQMEGIQRLCEAYAKLTFRKEVDVDVVNFVVEFYKKCLGTLGMNTENGVRQLDMRGRSINRDEFFEETFRSLEDDEGGVDGSDLADRLMEHVKFFTTDRSVMIYIQKKKDAGWLVEPRSGIYKRQPR